ncbi:hypothetical protein [Calothrix rhizosoleniae]|uniref:hypothetical protein n=1 Tax=Calothrix rhizosoleniae TaxID=888997 RepID=UPI000B49F69F|nr:hypothetical protein [Calothrix rhizosoleniae]
MSTKHAVNFGTKIIFSGIVIGFCAFHLISDRTPKNQELYLCGLVATLAYLQPSPKASTE